MRQLQSPIPQQMKTLEEKLCKTQENLNEQITTNIKLEDDIIQTKEHQVEENKEMNEIISKMKNDLFA